MTHPSSYEPHQPQGVQAPPTPPRRKRRVFMWVFLAVQALFLVWVVSSLSGAADNCDGRTGDALSACQAGTAVGAGLGLAVILFLWVAVDVILGITYLVTRRR
ncbi:hypothetical protein [Pseudonocardia humida]|uniref:Uncharacterized protein n=1 Tax=Pseudonocardia humida TaxID=2800819 RepID=A0ABT1AB71_9PSEU|nr:hypothetical protein [Pseudonocardia humida]MCO1660302.1 hypothetical protein [Pseudonocardia humida]